MSDVAAEKSSNPSSFGIRRLLMVTVACAGFSLWIRDFGIGIAILGGAAGLGGIAVGLTRWIAVRTGGQASRSALGRVLVRAVVGALAWWSVGWVCTNFQGNIQSVRYSERGIVLVQAANRLEDGTGLLVASFFVGVFGAAANVSVHEWAESKCVFDLQLLISSFQCAVLCSLWCLIGWGVDLVRSSQPPTLRTLLAFPVCIVLAVFPCAYLGGFFWNLTRLLVARTTDAPRRRSAAECAVYVLIAGITVCGARWIP